MYWLPQPVVCSKMGQAVGGTYRRGRVALWGWMGEGGLYGEFQRTMADLEHGSPRIRRRVRENSRSWEVANFMETTET